MTTLISLEKLSKKFGLKTRENAAVLDFLAVDNFDFTRKNVKKILGQKLVKMLGFWSKLNFLDKNLTFGIVIKNGEKSTS